MSVIIYRYVRGKLMRLFNAYPATTVRFGETPEEREKRLQQLAHKKLEEAQKKKTLREQAWNIILKTDKERPNTSN
jgi:hypothetical protein